MKKNFLQLFKKEPKREIVRFQKKNIFERGLNKIRNGAHSRYGNKGKPIGAGKNIIEEAEAKRRWKLAKNMILAFKIGRDEEVRI